MEAEGQTGTETKEEVEEVQSALITTFRTSTLCICSLFSSNTKIFVTKHNEAISKHSGVCVQQARLLTNLLDSTFPLI